MEYRNFINFNADFDKKHFFAMAYETPIDEKKLIEDLQDPGRAPDAFRVLIDKYGEKMYWQIRRMVISHEDANDLLQNCFIKVWTNLQNFRGDARLSTWLYKIAVNESINFLNKEKQRRHITDEEDASFLIDTLEADTYFDGDKLQTDLQKAVLNLPEKQRMVFNMKYFDDMRYEEISEVLGTSVVALKASYHRAVKKSTAYLDAESRE